LSRVILAFSTRIASVLVDFCVGWGAFVAFPTDDIIGITAHRTGCVLIGPVVGLFLGMIDNARRLGLFERQPKAQRRREKPRACVGWRGSPARCEFSGLGHLPDRRGERIGFEA
jgi:hypothetical protein